MARAIKMFMTLVGVWLINIALLHSPHPLLSKFQHPLSLEGGHSLSELQPEYL